MTDSALATITAAVLVFGGQLVTMFQNRSIGKKTETIKELADDNLSRITYELKEANSKIETQNGKINDLERLLSLLIDKGQR